MVSLDKKKKYAKKDGLFDKLRCHALDKHAVYKEDDLKEKLREQNG